MLSMVLLSLKKHPHLQLYGVAGEVQSLGKQDQLGVHRLMEGHEAEEGCKMGRLPTYHIDLRRTALRPTGPMAMVVVVVPGPSHRLEVVILRLIGVIPQLVSFTTIPTSGQGLKIMFPHRRLSITHLEGEDVVVVEDPEGGEAVDAEDHRQDQQKLELSRPNLPGD
jgi:hypothetical protein